MKQQITGIILAGGQSRRMGGGDKGLLDVAGQPMLARVIERLAPQVGRLAINANGEPTRFARFCLPVVPDTIDGFAGPLAGVLAGMRWASTETPVARWIATVSSDAPLLPLDVVDRLTVGLQNRPNSIAIARSGGELHPVIGLWPVALADDLEAALRDGMRKVLRWTDRHGTIPVDFPHIETAGGPVDPFFNANTPEELAEVTRLLADPLLATESARHAER